MSSSHVERKEQGDPFCSDIPEWLQEFRENLVDDRVPERRETHTPVLLMNHLWSLRLREVLIWVNTVFVLTSQTEIARSVRGPKLQGPPCRRRIGGAVPRAENFGKFSVKVANLETITDVQLWCRI